MKKILILVVLLSSIVFATPNEWMDAFDNRQQTTYHHGHYMVKTNFDKIKTNDYKVIHASGLSCISYISAGYETTYCGPFSVTNQIPIKR